MARDMIAEAPVEARKAEPIEEWRQVLLKAADLVETRGLAKFVQLDEETGAVCLHGAISIAQFGEPYCDPLDCDPLEASEAVARYLHSMGVPEKMADLRDCSRWNNAPERTQAEVVAALRGAAMSEAGL